MTQQYF